MTVTKRFAFIDNIKFAACMLVVLGHFVGSMVAQGIQALPTIIDYFFWTIYTFHVPVFFVCSGFLYQRANRVHSLQSYRSNVRKKFLDLGVPYVVFTTVTVLLKTLFEAEINTGTRVLWDALFLHPTAPYWYLYVLLAFFLCIPCAKGKRGALTLLLVAVVLRVGLSTLAIAGIEPQELLREAGGPYLLCELIAMIISLSKRLVWFALGIYLAFVDLDKMKQRAKWTAPLLLVAAIASSILYYRQIDSLSAELLQFVVGMLFVLFILYSSLCCSPKALNRLSARFSEYFMPVYVLHTIISAGIRIGLVHLGITSLAVHVLGGILGGIVLPIAVYAVCKKITPLMFFFYPTKTIKIMRQKHEQSKSTA